MTSFQDVEIKRKNINFHAIVFYPYVFVTAYSFNNVGNRNFYLPEFDDGNSGNHQNSS